MIPSPIFDLAGRLLGKAPEKGPCVAWGPGAPDGGLITRIWLALGEKALGATFWDGAPSFRKFRQILAGASGYGLAFHDALPLAFCWCDPLSPGPCRAAQLHLILFHATRSRLLMAARFFLLADASPARAYTSLLAFLPDRLRLARWLLARLNFREIASLPDCLLLEKTGNCENARLFLWQGQENG